MDTNVFPIYPIPDGIEALRQEVREFLAVEIADRKPVDRAETWTGADPAFSHKLGKRGWLGMTWPKRYGGHERTALERYVVIEELLAAGAPVAAHWFADRQSGPALLRFGSESQRATILPRIVTGECFFCVGMSESQAGSDLAAVRTRATKVDGGYRVVGTKLWTTNAHIAHYMILLARTNDDASNRHAGLSQFLVDLATPGIQISPIQIPTGKREFNEVVFDNVFLPDEALIGSAGEGWKQAMSELANERSGPERYLSSFMLLAEFSRVAGPEPSDRTALAIGRLCAHLVTLRRMSRSVAGQLQAGLDASLPAVIVKDLGAVFEQEIPEVTRLLTIGTRMQDDPDYAAVLDLITMIAPSFSLRGGTREILRGIIARTMNFG